MSPLKNLKYQGFTLLEQMVILVIVGVLASISAPSFLDIYNRSKLNQAVSQVQGALAEAQRQAMKKSSICSVIFNETNISSPDNCLLTQTEFPGGVKLAHNSTNTIKYGVRGNTTSNRTIVLSIEGLSEKKCLVLSNPLGIVRTGVYLDPSNGSIIASNCQKN